MKFISFCSKYIYRWLFLISQESRWNGRQPNMPNILYFDFLIFKILLNRYNAILIYCYRRTRTHTHTHIHGNKEIFLNVIHISHRFKNMTTRSCIRITHKFAECSQMNSVTYEHNNLSLPFLVSPKQRQKPLQRRKCVHRYAFCLLSIIQPSSVDYNADFVASVVLLAYVSILRVRSIPNHNDLFSGEVTYS